MSYQAPIKDMLFVMQDLAGIGQVAALPGFEDYLALIAGDEETRPSGSTPAGPPMSA